VEHFEKSERSNSPSPEVSTGQESLEWSEENYDAVLELPSTKHAETSRLPSIE
jgi:hypothetical protein